jgi:hypothetical protein
MYLAHDDLSKVAESLSGFPSDSRDARDIELGAFEPNAAGGGIHLSFRCVDSAGHAVVVVRLRTDGCKGPAEPESVSLYVPVEAGSIDSFVAKAQSIDNTMGGNAYLRMADHTVGWVQKNFPTLVRFSVPSWR